jgi:hypothetical protein
MEPSCTSDETARTVHDRDIALLDLDFGEIRRQEAVEVQPVVCRQVDPHAVDGQRHLQPAEAADEDVALVAAAVGVGRRGDARHQLHRLIERIDVEAPDLVLADGRVTDGLLADARCRDRDLAQREDVVRDARRLCGADDTTTDQDREVRRHAGACRPAH